MGLNKDILWKGLLEWIFVDLLRFLNPRIEQVFDLQQTPVFMDKELAAISPKSNGGATVRVVDKLVKVASKMQSAEVLVHVEVQGKTKKAERSLFGARMFTYFNLIFAKFSRPITAVAIYTGGDGHLFPKGYSYSLLNTRVQYNYKTINIWQYSDAELVASDNRFAWAMLVAKQALLTGKDRDRRLLEKKWMIFQKLYQHGLFEDRKLQAILVFMEFYLPFEDAEISRIFMQRVDSLTGKSNAMDIFEQVKEMKLEEARQEGMVEAREILIHDLVTNKKFSDEEIAKLAHVPVKKVTALRKQLPKN